jgi:hypothetical protein
MYRETGDGKEYVRRYENVNHTSLYGPQHGDMLQSGVPMTASSTLPN